jgi:hypothetical protein
LSGNGNLPASGFSDRCLNPAIMTELRLGKGRRETAEYHRRAATRCRSS